MENIWSRKHSECRKCGKNVIPHKALGYCKNCYELSKGYKWQKEYRVKNLDAIRKYQAEKARTAYKLGIWKRYDDTVLKKLAERDGRKCKMCSVTENLTIEHIIPRCVGGGNALDNLEILCKTCNIKTYHRLVKTALIFYFKNKMQ